MLKFVKYKILKVIVKKTLINEVADFMPADSEMFKLPFNVKIISSSLSVRMKATRDNYII